MKQGSTRNVFLTKKYAIKIPRFVEWRLFLFGLLGNMQETFFWKQLKSDKLCPVLFAIPCGFMIVMARASEFSCKDHAEFDFDSFVDAGDWVIPAENKQDSFGWFQGRIVAIDYGDSYLLPEYRGY